MDLPADRRGSLVLLVAAAGAGKSTVAAAWPASCVVSSDAIRGELCGDATDQTVTADAFAVLHARVADRCARGLSTVVDATNAESQHRQTLLAIANNHAVPTVALVLDTPVSTCRSRNAARPDPVPDDVVLAQHTQIQNELPTLPDEGFTSVLVCSPHDAAVLKPD